MAPADALAPERLIPILLSAGVISPAEAVLEGAMLRHIGRSHPVWRLDVAGRPRAAVKLFGPDGGRTSGSAACETAVQALAVRVPALAALLPAALPHAGPPWLVVTSWVEGHAAWQAPAGGSDGDTSRMPGELESLGPMVAPALAAMHRATARLVASGDIMPKGPLNGGLPWVLTLFDGDSPTELWSHGRVTPVLAAGAQRPLLVAGVRRARQAWRAIALIHGDLKHDNLMLRADGGFTLIDWEMARVGDPAWDLAGLMFRPLMDPDRPGWCADNVAAARMLLEAYAGASGLARRPLAQRLLLYCGAWLLMSVVQYRSATDQPDAAEIRRQLEAAEQSLEASAALVAALAGDATDAPGGDAA